MPRISVIIPTYNSEKYLRESIESILNQTYQDFEICIIDDHSKDNTIPILDSYNDPRIRIILGQQKGISAALNLGIKSANGEFIARMDSDDVSCLDRFEKQISFMDAHPEVALCGAWIKTFEGTVWELPTDAIDIKTQLLFSCAIHHPVVMFRREIFKIYNFYYNEQLLGCEDFDLWQRVSEHLIIRNISEVLLIYRCHAEQTSTTQLLRDYNISIEMIPNFILKVLGVKIPDKYRAIFLYNSMPKYLLPTYTISEYFEIMEIFQNMIASAMLNPLYSITTLKKLLFRKKIALIWDLKSWSFLRRITPKFIKRIFKKVVKILHN